MILFEGKKGEMYVDDRIIIFAMKMQRKLESNHHKGNIFDWNPNFQNWLYEFEYHKSKLIAAIMAKDKHLQREFACDLANYLLLMIN